MRFFIIAEVIVGKKKHHRALPGRHGPARQSKALVVSAVDVPHQFVHFGAVPVGRHLQGFFEGGATGEKAAETEKGSPSEAAM